MYSPSTSFSAVSGSAAVGCVQNPFNPPFAITTVRQSAQQLSRTPVKKSPGAGLPELPGLITQHWETFIKENDVVTALEKLLFLLSDKFLQETQTSELLAILNNNGVQVNKNALPPALAVARVRLDAAIQQLIETTWNRIARECHLAGKCERLKLLLDELSYLHLHPAQMRRGLLAMKDHLNVPLPKLCPLMKPFKVILSEKMEKWVKENLKVASRAGKPLDILIALLQRPGYEDCHWAELKSALDNAGLRMSDDMIKLAQTAFRTKIAERQQRWFDSCQRRKHKETKQEWLLSLLSQKDRPGMDEPQFWLLLYNAGSETSMTTVRNVMKLQGIAQDQYIAQVKSRWDAINRGKNISNINQLMLLLLCLKHQSIPLQELHDAMELACVPIERTELGQVYEAVRTHVSREEAARFRIISHATPVFGTPYQQMVRMLGQWEDLPELSAAKALRLLWESKFYPASFAEVIMALAEARGEETAPASPHERLDLEWLGPSALHFAAVEVVDTPALIPSLEQWYDGTMASGHDNDVNFRLNPEQELKWSLDQELS
ncbi:hypothetical protein HA50_28915 [Pantoea cypripedii]|uniref:Uncharacterized protein n=1 Tax=Pantoea cypripedii TaxID=55209 RepID=A0A1X1EGB8_PANCY|nr:hypothetical protein HA50_28915 [Pantoea cypripedii]